MICQKNLREYRIFIRIKRSLCKKIMIDFQFVTDTQSKHKERLPPSSSHRPQNANSRHCIPRQQNRRPKEGTSSPKRRNELIQYPKEIQLKLIIFKFFYKQILVVNQLGEEGNVSFRSLNHEPSAGTSSVSISSPTELSSWDCVISKLSVCESD